MLLGASHGSFVIMIPVKLTLAVLAKRGPKPRRNKSQRLGHMEFDKTVWMVSRYRPLHRSSGAAHRVCMP